MPRRTIERQLGVRTRINERRLFSVFGHVFPPAAGGDPEPDLNFPGNDRERSQVYSFGGSMKNQVRPLQTQRFVGVCLSGLVMLLWSWAAAAAISGSVEAGQLQSDGQRFESLVTGGGTAHSGLKVNPGNISIEGSWSWSVANGQTRIQVSNLVNRRSGGTSGTLRLEVWASASPYNGGTLTGYKIGQMQLGTLAAGFQYTNLDYTVTQLTTPPNGSWYMTMIASEFDGSSLNNGFSFVDWEAMSPNWLIGVSGSISFDGSAVSTTITSTTVRIQVAKVVNHRSGGTSGTLRLEVWASAAPYNGGTLTGYKLGQQQIGQLAAGFQFTNLDYTVALLVTPPNGTYKLTMIVSEFDGSALNNGYSFVDWLAMTPDLVIGGTVGFVTVVEFYNQPLNHYFRLAVNNLNKGIEGRNFFG